MDPICSNPKYGCRVDVRRLVILAGEPVYAFYRMGNWNSKRKTCCGPAHKALDSQECVQYNVERSRLVERFAMNRRIWFDYTRPAPWCVCGAAFFWPNAGFMVQVRAD